MLLIDGFTCERCGNWRDTSVNTGVGTGYATYEGKKVCYGCCADIDKEHMRADGKIVLYLVSRNIPLTLIPGRGLERTDKRWFVTNWPGTLEFALGYGAPKTSWHNFAGRNGRSDVWFPFEGFYWHGVNIGDNQVLRCRRTKETYTATHVPPPVQPVAKRALDLTTGVAA